MDFDRFIQQVEDEEFDVDNDRQRFIHLNHFMMKRTLRNAPAGAVRPRRGSLVTISFFGEVPFPRTVVENVENFRCHLGDFEVINGLEIALYTMRVGEIAQLVMNSSFAYGIFGLEDPNSEDDYLVKPYENTVFYQIELISVENELIEDLNDDEVLRQWVIRKKSRADFWAKRLEYHKTLHLYNRAEEYLLQYNGNRDVLALGVGLWPRTRPIPTLVYNRITRVYVDTLDVLDEALEIDPYNSIVLYHKAKLMVLMGQTAHALRLMLMVIQLDRNNMDARVECAYLERYYHMQIRALLYLLQEHIICIALFICMIVVMGFA